MAVWTVDSRAAATAVMWVAAKAETKVDSLAEWMVGWWVDPSVHTWVVQMDVLTAEMMVASWVGGTVERLVLTKVDEKADLKAGLTALVWAAMRAAQ